MPIVPINGRSIVTPLWYVAIKLRAVADKFHDLYEATDGAWLIGPYLSWPFWFISYQLELAASYMIDAETLLAQMKIWLDGLVEGTAFRDILFWVSGSFRDITIDAVSFVMRNFEGISGEMTQLVNSPITWFLDKVNLVLPGIRHISQFPLDFVYDNIRNLFYNAIQFLETPLSTLRGWLSQMFWWFNEFNISPRQTVLNWVYDSYPWLANLFRFPSQEIANKLLTHYPLIAAFMSNPTLWFKRELGDLFGVPYWQLLSPGILFIDKILGIILLRRARFENRLKQVVSEIILWFI